MCACMYSYMCVCVCVCVHALMCMCILAEKHTIPSPNLGYCTRSSYNSLHPPSNKIIFVVELLDS